MKCYVCGNPMQPETDRIKCVICGHSRWDNFQLRRPNDADRRYPKGVQPGLRSNFGKYPESLKETRV